MFYRVLILGFWVASSVRSAEIDPLSFADRLKTLVQQLTGPPLDKLHRERKSFEFYQFIKSEPYPGEKNERQNLVKDLNNIIRNRDVSKILSEDLPFIDKLFIAHKLHALEILSQPSYSIKPGNEYLGIYGLTGNIEINGMSITGTLIPLPILNLDPSAIQKRPLLVKWYVLSCAHIKLPNGTRGPQPLKASFNKGIYGFPLKSKKVFRKEGEDVSISYPSFPAGTINKISLEDYRAKIITDGEGDMALYELGIEQEMHDFLSEDILGEGYRLPECNNNVLQFKLVSQENCYIHFISNEEEAVDLVKEANKHTLHKVLGYATLGIGKQKRFIQSSQRDTLLVEGVFSSSKEFIASGEQLLGHYQFYFNAPTYPGMSGGLIFYRKEDSIRAYGVVPGTHQNVNTGIFLQKRIFLNNDGSVNPYGAF